MDSKRLTKNLTFAMGLGFLIYGALFLAYPDWDIGVSLLMAGITYFTADWVVDVIRRRDYPKWPLAVFYTWLAVDGSYWAYWSVVRPEVMIREGQWLASLCMYLLCGVIWQGLPTPRELHGLMRRAASPSKD